MKKILISSLLLLSAATAASGAGRKGAVAIVVDGTSYPATETSVQRYARAIGKYDGKKTYIIEVAPDCRPELIRDTLKYLYRKKGLEGAVLVGDIPVPMIRRAHHLATAFKMNPKMPVKRSSIPSDRFYDDFDLSFRPLESDGKLFYYDLMPDGAQVVDCEIYTARIKPARTDPGHSFDELVCEFLDRAALAKESREPLDRVFHFGGHGNSSESINARIDEDRAYYEQFGLREPEGRVSYLNFDEDRYTRTRLLAALADPEVDFAHLHTHGGVDAQYISKEPYTYMTSEHLENAKAAFRSKMRRSKDKEKTAAELMKSWDIPRSWLDGWDDGEVSRRDSVRSASVDITLPDLDGYAPGAKVILLDACFNGAFLHPDYVAARYAFAHGSRTFAVTANSVNIIQDHWKNELAGLLVTGECVGGWARHYMTLESHLFGDPTYSFAKSSSTTPDLRALKIHEGRYSCEKCLGILRDDPSMNVRLEAFWYIMRHSTELPLVRQAILSGLEDPYEMLRRMASRYAEVCGEQELLPAIASHYLDPMESARIRYHLFNALQLYGAEEVDAALRSAWDGIWPSASDFGELCSRMQKIIRSSDSEIGDICNPDADIKERRLTISAQRNSCKPAAVEPMLRLIADPQADEELRETAAEALGWYTHSPLWGHIYMSLKGTSTGIPAVDDEITRTLRRLEDNARTN